MSVPHDPDKIAVEAAAMPARAKPSNYPEPFFSRMLKREKRPLGDAFGIQNFGVNLTTLHPGGETSLVTEQGEVKLSPGMCAGFPARGIAHQLVNRTDSDGVYLEVGDRTPGDEGSYPVDDLAAALGADGKWQLTHKDGVKY